MPSFAYGIPQPLQSLFEQALQANESILLQDELLTQRDEQTWQAIAPMLPQLSVSTLLLKQTALPSGIANQFSPENQTTLKFGATQSLFRGLKDFAQISKQSTLKDAQTYRRAATLKSLYVDLAQAYIASLQTRNDVALLEREVGINQKRLSELRNFQSQGRNRQSELLALESTVASQEALLAQTRGALQSTEEQLAFQIGAAPRPLEIAEDSLPEMGALETNLENLSTLIESRPEVIAAKFDVEAAEQGANIARGGHLPSADLGANYYVQRPGLLVDVKWDVSLSATWVLFAGGAVSSQQRQAQSELKTQELQLARIRRQAELEIRTLFGLTTTGQEQVLKLKSATGFAEKSYSNEQRNYRSGLATILEVLQAQALWLQTQRGFDRARLNWKLDRIRYEAAVGRLPIKKAGAP